MATPDENSYIERAPNGPSTNAYRALRERARAHYARQADILPGKATNVGQCWVSRVSATPTIWERAIREELDELSREGGGRRLRIFARHQLRGVSLLANGKFNYADLVNLDSGKVTRIGARYLLDATEDGSGLALCGLPTTFGQEAQSEFGEAHAPPVAHPEWVQSFTYCFAVRWAGADEPHPIVARPDEYDEFKSLGVYSLDYEYYDRGIVPYDMLKTAKGAAGPFWTYRRLIAASSFAGGKSPVGDIALINWRWQRFPRRVAAGQAARRAGPHSGPGGDSSPRASSITCKPSAPGDDAPDTLGYPEIQPLGAPTLPDVDDEGFALAPYVRESRRLEAQFTLDENHLTAPPDAPDAKWGQPFFDSVGCALYAIDVHPAQGEPPLLVKALPYHIPLGSFLTVYGPANVLPAAKNIGATRLAMASARMHPTEWLVGEVAGNLAAFCLRRDIDAPSVVRNDPALLAAFQAMLRENGVTLYWRDILSDANKREVGTMKPSLTYYS